MNDAVRETVRCACVASQVAIVTGCGPTVACETPISSSLLALESVVSHQKDVVRDHKPQAARGKAIA